MLFDVTLPLLSHAINMSLHDSVSLICEWSGNNLARTVSTFTETVRHVICVQTVWYTRV